MTKIDQVYASYSAASVRAARQDFYRRATAAALVLAKISNRAPDDHSYGVVNAFRFGLMVDSCVRHAAKAAGLRARDLWQVLPKDAAERVETMARVSAVY